MKIFVVDEIAQILRVPKGRVYDLVRRGKLPAVRIGRQVRFREESVNAWLEGLDGERASTRDDGPSIGFGTGRHG
jgi:putative molybdopterin biosynthesis protein